MGPSSHSSPVLPARAWPFSAAPLFRLAFSWVCFRPRVFAVSWSPSLVAGLRGWRSSCYCPPPWSRSARVLRGVACRLAALSLSCYLVLALAGRVRCFCASLVAFLPVARRFSCLSVSSPLPQLVGCCRLSFLVFTCRASSAFGFAFSARALGVGVRVCVLAFTVALLTSHCLSGLRVVARLRLPLCSFFVPHRFSCWAVSPRSGRSRIFLAVGGPGATCG